MLVGSIPTKDLQGINSVRLYSLARKTNKKFQKYRAFDFTKEKSNMETKDNLRKKEKFKRRQYVVSVDGSQAKTPPSMDLHSGNSCISFWLLHPIHPGVLLFAGLLGTVKEKEWKL
jgi:hypothetical protein